MSRFRTFAAIMAALAGNTLAISAVGDITTVAGNGEYHTGLFYDGVYVGDGGPATRTRLNRPQSVAVDARGNLFIADWSNHRVRRVDAATAVISTVAGNGAMGFSSEGGPATSANLDFPHGVAVDASGNVFIADTSNNRIRRVEGGAAAPRTPRPSLAPWELVALAVTAVLAAALLWRLRRTRNSQQV